MIMNKYFVVFFVIFIIHLSEEGILDLNLNVGAVDSVLAVIGINDSEKTTVKTTTSHVNVKYQDDENVCGIRKIKHTGLIKSGSPTKPGDWPWHVALFKIKSTGAEQKYICGGSLLSNTRVVTAGHCVIENGVVILPERLFAVMGKHNMVGGDIGSQERGVFEIVLHPEFSLPKLENDIAILKLAAEVSFSDYIQPICLWSASDTDKSKLFNRIGTVVGWGFTEDNILSNQLIKALIPVKEDVTCIKFNPTFYAHYLTDNTYCAGYANGTSPCNGDSGGGMFFSKMSARGEEIWSLRGIVSLSIRKKDMNVCDGNTYAIFTDSVHYLDFITDNLNLV